MRRHSLIPFAFGRSVSLTRHPSATAFVLSKFGPTDQPSTVVYRPRHQPAPYSLPRQSEVCKSQICPGRDDRAPTTVGPHPPALILTHCALSPSLLLSSTPPFSALRTFDPSTPADRRHIQPPLEIETPSRCAGHAAYSSCPDSAARPAYDGSSPTAGVASIVHTTFISRRSHRRPAISPGWSLRRYPQRRRLRPVSPTMASVRFTRPEQELQLAQSASQEESAELHRRRGWHRIGPSGFSIDSSPASYTRSGHFAIESSLCACRPGAVRPHIIRQFQQSQGQR